MNYIFKALFILAFLTACGPSLYPSGTRGNPVPTSRTVVAKVQSNNETFVRVAGPAGLLPASIFAQEELKFTSYNEIAPGATRRIIVNWIEQVSTNAPTNWKLEIVRQEGVATITESRSTGTGISYKVSYTLELIVSVKVPAGTPAGSYPITMTIAEIARKQNTGPVYLNLEVPKSE